MGSGGEGGARAGAASLREPHDFSNVASFSELPFLGSASPRESPNSGGIRIFGIQVPHLSPEGKAKETTTTVAAAAAAATTAATQSSSGGAPNSSRKFECHYCCRHFPTSQALGGHQNAHKRERKHAKRVQMQSAMAAAAGGMHHHHLLGYPQHRSGVASNTVATLYLTWPTATSPGGGGSTIGPQFYSGIGLMSQTITGNPLTAGLWRGPTAGHGNISIPPRGERRPVVFRGDEPRASTSLLALPSSSSSSMLLSSPQGQFVCEQPETTASEGVSLDLHL